ncbi:MAG: polysaccharide ABC transporter ATP-binding protein [Rubrivivax sp.]
MSSETAGSASAGEAVIQVQAAGKTYRLYDSPADRLWQALWPGRHPRFRDFKALQDVSFELRRGEVMGIVGVNGAGKSTLLQLVTGTISPTQGTVRTRGRVAAILELGSGFNPEFTGRENVYLNAATLGLSKAEIDARIDAIIGFAGIGAHIDQPVKTYSSGMQVRLAFSIATSVDPDVLIIDEALSVGDGAFGRRSFDRIQQIKARGATILFCSHVLFHVETFCDRAVWLHGGRVQKMGPVSEVLRPYQEFIDAYAQDANAQPDAAPLLAAPAPQAPAPGGEAAVAPAAVTTPAAAAATAPAGTARLQVVRVRLGGQAGTELHGTSLVSALQVDIAFSSDPALPPPTAALVLSSESGKILGSCSSYTQGVVFERGADGAGVGRITIDRIPLNKGRYRVGAYLLCERGFHVYEMADPAAFITLDHPGAEQGTQLLDGAWEDGPLQEG